MRYGVYYAGFQTDERVQRLADLQRIRDTGFDLLISPFSNDDPNCLKAAQVCSELGIKVMLQPNALTPDQFKAKYAALANIEVVDIWDDAHAAKITDITAKRDLWKAAIGPNRLLSITCARGTSLDYVNLVPLFCAQYYSWKEANWLKRNYWDDVTRLVAASTSGRVAPTLWLGMNAVPWPLRNNPDWRTQDREYTPVKQQEAAMLMALCAGASDLLFYTAYEYPNQGGLALESGKSYILDRPIWLAQYKAVFAKLRKLDAQYFSVGKRQPFAVGTTVGATWMLPDGSGVKITIDYEVEVYPDVRIDPIPVPIPPAPPASATIKVSSDGRAITVEKLP
jgi:hypothetical protein